MTNQDNRSKDVEDLRQKAEALALERADRTPQDSAALSPEEIRKTLHELRVLPRKMMGGSRPLCHRN